MSLPRSTVVVVGPGRTGTVIAAGLARRHRVLGAAGGSDASRQRFASRFAGTRTSADPAELVPHADLVVLATPDDVLEQVVRDLAVADAFGPAQRVVHVSGARGVQVLRRAELAGAATAACHPAQTVPSATASADVLVGAAWAVTAAPGDRGWAHAFVEDLGGTPFDVDEDVRVLYHAALVIGSNAIGAVVSVARQLLLGARVEHPEAFLAPLVEASAGNAMRSGASALTGPVVRGDVGTVEAHLAALDADVPELAEAYRRLSAVILDQARLGLTGSQVRSLRDVLRDPPSEPAP